MARRGKWLRNRIGGKEQKESAVEMTACNCRKRGQCKKEQDRKRVPANNKKQSLNGRCDYGQNTCKSVAKKNGGYGWGGTNEGQGGIREGVRQSGKRV